MSDLMMMKDCTSPLYTRERYEIQYCGGTNVPVLVRGLWQQRCILMLKKENASKGDGWIIQRDINIKVLVSWSVTMYEVG